MAALVEVVGVKRPRPGAQDEQQELLASVSSASSGDTSVSSVSPWEELLMDNVLPDGALKPDFLAVDIDKLIAEAADATQQEMFIMTLASTTDAAVQARVIQCGVLSPMKDWLRKQVAARNTPFVVCMLQYLFKMPVDLGALKTSKIGAIVAKLGSAAGGDNKTPGYSDTAVVRLADSIYDKWKRAAASANKASSAANASKSAAASSTVMSSAGSKATGEGAQLNGGSQERDRKRARMDDALSEDTLPTPASTSDNTLAPAAPQYQVVTPPPVSSLPSLAELTASFTASLPNLYSSLVSGSSLPDSDAASTFSDTSMDDDEELSEESGYWKAPTDIDNSGEVGIAEEEMNGIVRSKGVGLPDRYGKVKGGILKNKIAGVVGGKALASSTQSTGLSYADLVGSASTARRGLKWVDSLSTAAARDAQKRIPKASIDAFQSDGLVAVKFFSKEARPNVISGAKAPAAPPTAAAVASAAAATAGTAAGVGASPSAASAGAAASAPGVAQSVSAAKRPGEEEEGSSSDEETPVPEGGAADGSAASTGPVSEEEKARRFEEAKARERMAEGVKARAALAESMHLRPQFPARGPMAGPRLPPTSRFPMTVVPACASAAGWAARDAAGMPLAPRIALPPYMPPRPTPPITTPEYLAFDAYARRVPRVAYPLGGAPSNPASVANVFEGRDPTRIPEMLQPLPAVHPPAGMLPPGMRPPPPTGALPPPHMPPPGGVLARPPAPASVAPYGMPPGAVPGAAPALAPAPPLLQPPPPQQQPPPQHPSQHPPPPLHQPLGGAYPGYGAGVGGVPLPAPGRPGPGGGAPPHGAYMGGAPPPYASAPYGAPPPGAMPGYGAPPYGGPPPSGGGLLPPPGAPPSHAGPPASHAGPPPTSAMDPNIAARIRRGNKRCLYFNSPTGCRNGASCPFVHDPSFVATREELTAIANPAARAYYANMRGAGGAPGGPPGGPPGGVPTNVMPAYTLPSAGAPPAPPPASGGGGGGLLPLPPPTSTA